MKRIRRLHLYWRRILSSAHPVDLANPEQAFPRYHLTITKEANTSGCVSMVHAAMAAAAMGTGVAVCEAFPEDGANDDAEYSIPILELWYSLDETLHRLQAAALLPESIDIPKPKVTILPGRLIEVVFELPQALDIPRAIHELRRSISKPSAKTTRNVFASASTVEEHSYGTEGRAIVFRRRSTTMGELSVEIAQPNDATRPAMFLFRGNPGEDNYDLISMVLHAAMTPRQHAASTPMFEKFFSSDGLDQLEVLRSGMRELMEILQRDMRMPDSMSIGKDESAAEAVHTSYQGLTEKLESLGAQVYLPSSETSSPTTSIDWGSLAGYEDEKRALEDTLLLPLLYPQVYADIVKRTRPEGKDSSIRARAVLLEGPPGTGKTSSAKVLAYRASVPFVYIPLERLVSKWYGEGEKNLAALLEACNEFPNGCMVFLDELDALARARGQDTHEASTRLLGVLLRHIDGFDANSGTVVVGATNRKVDLDPALRSRFSATVHFGLPNLECRTAILASYAFHLAKTELITLAKETEGMSGRDLRDIAEFTERSWASKIIRNEAAEGTLPQINDYRRAAEWRKASTSLR